MFTAALSTTPKMWKKLDSPLEGMNGLVKCDVCMCMYVWTMDHYSALREEGNSDMHYDVDGY